MPVPPTQRGTLQTKGASLYSTSSRVGSSKPRIFLGSAGLDLDLNVHSRTDPVKALGTLLKLLTSLPSRIGGCQYKLTPAEHTLSLHLISIVDPFVCHGARALATSICDGPGSSLSSLVDQPTEILDAILSHVDSRKDLLSIGLVCKRLGDIIFPRHFDYRVIRCKLSSISLWNHLIIHKSLARNVRKLEILDERSATSLSSAKHSYILTPSISQRDTDLENTDDELRMHSKQEKYLSEALLHMTGLEEFKWSCNHSPISIANVWPTLMVRAPNLRTLEICDNLLFGPRFSSAESGDSSDSGDSDHDEADQPRTYFHSGLMTPGFLSTTNAVFRSTPHSFGAPKQPDLKRISSMLQKCPQLESLEITYIPPRVSGNPTGGQGTTSRLRPLADDFFIYSGWTSTLTTLMLNNLRCSTSSAPLTFLSEHPALEVLHLDINLHTGSFSGPNCLPHGSLPNLREIKSSKEVINAILECPSDGPRPLRTLKGFKLSGQIPTSVNPSRSVPDSVFLSNLKHQTTLYKVELSGWHDMEDIRKLVPSIPNVQYLSLGKRIGAMGRRIPGGGSGPSANITEWIDLLSTLPDLSTLHGVKFFYEVPTSTFTESPPRSNDHSVVGSLNVFKSQFVVSQLSMMERSRMRKNDEVAGVLAWKCGKLRWVDHWEDGSGKIIHLVRDRCGEGGKDKVRWEVKRSKNVS